MAFSKHFKIGSVTILRPSHCLVAHLLLFFLVGGLPASSASEMVNDTITTTTTTTIPSSTKVLRSAESSSTSTSTPWVEKDSNATTPATTTLNKMTTTPGLTPTTTEDPTQELLIWYKFTGDFDPKELFKLLKNAKGSLTISSSNAIFNNRIEFVEFSLAGNEFETKTLPGIWKRHEGQVSAVLQFTGVLPEIKSSTTINTSAVTTGKRPIHTVPYPLSPPPSGGSPFKASLKNIFKVLVFIFLAVVVFRITFHVFKTCSTNCGSWEEFKAQCALVKRNMNAWYNERWGSRLTRSVGPPESPEPHPDYPASSVRYERF